MRTGGHYRILYSDPGGFRQFRYALNHWSQSASGELLVHSIAVPYAMNDIEIFAEFAVGDGWEMDFSCIIGLAPLLQSPRVYKKFNVNKADVLQAHLSGVTIHICWTESSHETIIVSNHEPRFRFFPNEFEKSHTRK